MASRTQKLTAIDLFCGCGGLSLGLRRAGFEVVGAIDNDPISTSTYEMNHKRTHVIRDDIQSIKPSTLRRKLGLTKGELDLLSGCPPCQGFSRLRTLNGGRNVEEPMNDLVYEFVRFVRGFLPKTLMIENVPALLDDSRLQKLGRGLERLGYRWEARLFDAERYGVAQKRQRMILLGSRGDCPPFAHPIRRRRTVAEAIRKLPAPAASRDPLHNYSVRRADHVMALIRRIPRDGGSRTDLPDIDQLECHRRLDGFRDVYGRMAWKQPAPTITGGCINPSKGRFLHPEDDRAITLREAAVLQGFPMSYMFDMSRGRYPAAQMIGNAFPPKFAEHHARAVHDYLQARQSLTQ